MVFDLECRLIIESANNRFTIVCYFNPFSLSSPFLPFIRIVTVIPFVDLTFRFAALIKDRRVLKKALKKLSQIFPNQKSTFPIVLRLKDSEIQKFASQPVEKLLEYLEDEVPKSPRIRQILAQFC